MEVIEAAWWPALLAGLLAVAVTVAIERWGGTVGGLLGTLPTTIVPASLGIFAQSAATEAFVASMCTVPFGMLLNAIFLYLWRVLPPRLPGRWPLRLRLSVMVAGSLGAWLVMAVAMVVGFGKLRQMELSMWVVGLVGMGLLLAFGVWGCLERPPSPKGGRRVSPQMLAARGVMAAVAIGAAIWIAAVGGDIASGAATVFPAIFLTTMVALWISQDEAVQAGAIGPMMLGSSSVAAYALGAGLLMPVWGPWLAAPVCWVGAVLLTTLPFFILLKERRQVSGEDEERVSAR